MAPDRNPELLAQYDNEIRERLQIEPGGHPDGPLIDLRDVALLGDLAPTTPGMARQRTRRGVARHPFPDPDPDEGLRWSDKPLFRAYLICDYFGETGNWPPGKAARPAQRHPRKAPKTPAAPDDEKITWTRLREKDPELADKIKAAKLNDGARRSPEQWKHRYEHTSGDHHEVVHTAPRAKRSR